jgi:hypothetical protein
MRALGFTPLAEFLAAMLIAAGLALLLGPYRYAAKHGQNSSAAAE